MSTKRLSLGTNRVGMKRLVTDDANHFFLSLKISGASAVQIEETRELANSTHKRQQVEPGSC